MRVGNTMDTPPTKVLISVIYVGKWGFIKIMKFEFYLKWIAHGVIVLATLATAFDISPANKVLFLLGSVLWAWIGIRWKQPSLWTLNVFCASMYVVGLLVGVMYGK